MKIKQCDIEDMMIEMKSILDKYAEKFPVHTLLFNMISFSAAIAFTLAKDDSMVHDMFDEAITKGLETADEVGRVRDEKR